MLASATETREHCPSRHDPVRVRHPYGDVTLNEGWWLRGGPASRCAQAVFLWGFLTVFSVVLLLLLLLLLGEVAWWARLGQGY
jgi:hypothetical protein